MRTIQEITKFDELRLNRCAAVCEGVDTSALKPTPQYCTDANAILRARQALTEDEMCEWCIAMNEVLDLKQPRDGDDPGFSISAWLEVLNATPRQQTIAYVFVMQPDLQQVHQDVVSILSSEPAQVAPKTQP